MVKSPIPPQPADKALASDTRKHSLIEFPSRFPIKVMGLNEGVGTCAD
jgi:hypothetical protein